MVFSIVQKNKPILRAHSIVFSLSFFSCLFQSLRLFVCVRLLFYFCFPSSTTIDQRSNCRQAGFSSCFPYFFRPTLSFFLFLKCFCCLRGRGYSSRETGFIDGVWVLYTVNKCAFITWCASRVQRQKCRWFPPGENAGRVTWEKEVGETESWLRETLTPQLTNYYGSIRMPNEQRACMKVSYRRRLCNVFWICYKDKAWDGSHSRVQKGLKGEGK